MHQSTTWPPACARAFAQGYGLRSKAMAGRQSRNTHRSWATLRMALNQPSRISAHIERDLAKLFFGGA